jgi:hypothetical protein
MIVRGVLVDVVDREVTVMVAIDVVMLVRVRRVVRRESLRLLSVVDLVEVVEILLHLLRIGKSLDACRVEYYCHSTAALPGWHHRKALRHKGRQPR